MAIQSAGFGRTTSGPVPEGVLATIGDGHSTLAALRKWRGLTCSELSDLSGVDLIIIMLAERGSDLLPEERDAIARILSVSPEMMGV
jgi:hypothetical protein